MAEGDHPLDDPLGWRGAKAPTLADFEIIAEMVRAALPTRFLALIDGVVLHIDDFPSDEVVEEMELESEFDLLGLFTGVGLPFQSGGGQTGQMPNMVFLYRRPILDYWAEHDEALGAIIAHVLIHEIGHHFGLSDDDMEALEAEGRFGLDQSAV